MTPEEWGQVDHLFAEALPLAPPERVAFLDRSCSNPEVRREVESLLAHASAEADDLRDLVGQAAALVPEPPAPPPAPDLAGQRLGPYLVVRLIGKGGMGEIYAAEDPRLGRQVALKILSSAVMENAGSVRRFQQEARAASALNHPNIVTVHDFGQSGGVSYIATELVVGRTLRDIISKDKLSLSEVLAVAIQIGEALAAAHAAGIVHRDIKPENIMVRPDGYVKVLDFGLAKLCQPETPPDQSITNTGPNIVMGTVRYMSPERVRGLEIDGRSDLFSLGVVLYEMLAHRCPFQGETAVHTLTAILDQEPEPIHVHAPGVPPKLEAIVSKCLGKDRAQRYQVAQDLVADLRQLKQDMDASGAATVPMMLRERGKRTRLTAMAAALAGLALAAALYYSTRPGPPPWFPNKRLTRIPGNGPSNTGVISPDGRYLAYVTLLANGSRSLHLRLLTSATGMELMPPAMVTYPSMAFAPDGSYLYYVWRGADAANAGTLFRVPVPGGTPQKLLENVSGKLSVSPDGSALAFMRRSRRDGTLFVVNPDGSGEREVLRRQAEFVFQSVDWSPDSRQIVFVETTRDPNGMDCRIYSVGRNGGAPRQLIRMLKAFIYDLAVLPEGRGYLANAFDTEAGLPQIWHVSPTGVMQRITQDLSQYQGMSATRDGRRILSSQTERLSELWVVDRDNPASARLLTEPARRFDTPVWTHEGSIVSARFDAGKWVMWALAPDGSSRRPVLPNPTTELEPNVCPDRGDIVFVSDQADVFTIWRVRSDGTNLKQLTFGPADRSPHCVAGGTVLYRVQSGGRRATMQIDIDGTKAAVLAPDSYQTFPQFVSPNGRMVLSTYIDDKTREERIDIRDRQSDATIARFPFGGKTAAVAWAPDSQGFADAYAEAAGNEVWYQPVPSGTPRQLTQFGNDAIFSLNWSPNGKQLVVARGRFISDMVLIEGVK